MSTRLLLSSALGASALLALVAQANANGPSTSPDQAVRALLADQGAGLRVKWDFGSGYANHVYGKAMDFGTRPTSDEDFGRAALAVFDKFPGLGGYDSSVLVVKEIHRLDLERIGTTNKVAVVLQQVVDGVEVEQGTAAVIFSEADGKVLSIQNDGVPNVGSVNVIPDLSEAQAIQYAKDGFGHTVREVISSELTIIGRGSERLPELVYNVALEAEETNHDLPIVETLSVDADSGSVLRRRGEIHTAVDLLVWSRSWVTPGTKPDTSSNPEVLENGRHIFHNSAVGSDHSDLNGNVVIPYGGTSVQTVTSDFGVSSLYCRVVTQTGSNLSNSKSFTPGVSDQLRFNRGRLERGTAQANSQHHVVVFREYVKSINGTGSPFNFQVRANPNISSTCNAYYNGSSINFYLAGGSCVNTAYSTVVAHEEGHWANDLYGSNNGGDGFGEGNADNFATYIYDTNLVGENFCGNGCHVRNGDNTRQYCGSCGSGCYGGVHADGEVLMGACWKVRKRLNTAHGDTAGDLIADTLLVRWMETYNDKTICTIVRDHWLVLDDNDGNLGNGTPNKAHIDGGFVDQGFPPY